MTVTRAASGVQLARAEVLGKALTQRGWTRRHEPRAKHPGAVAVTVLTRPGIEILILTLGGRDGLMVEVLSRSATNHRGKGGDRVRTVCPSWRMTAYDAPIEAILAAATTAVDGAMNPSSLELPGWTVEHAPARRASGFAEPYRAEAKVPLGGKVRATRFTRPDDAVTATFHLPTFAPPCESCTHHGELGDTGGWLIIGPGFTAEATSHTPARVIAAFTSALPGHCPDPPSATPEAQRAESQRGAEPVSATTVGRDVRPVPAVCR